MPRTVVHRRALSALGVVVVALSGVFVSAAAAAQSDPPGWVDPGNNEWVAFTIDGYPPARTGRTTFAPVTLVRTASPTLDLISAFNNWEVIPDGLGPGADQYLWPPTFSNGDVQLTRVDACEYSQSTCRYAVVSPGSGEFWFFGGTPPTDAGGQPDPNPADFNEGSLGALPGPLTITLGTLNATGAPGTGGAAGTIHVDAAGTADQLSGTTLTYSWVLKGPRGKEYTSSGPADFFEVPGEVDGVYCVELTVTASDGHTVATPTCDAGGATFSITGVAPVKQPAPAPTPGGGGGGTPPSGGGGGGGIPGIGFTNPARRAPATLTGGTSSSPTVVWLWRPEWYSSTPEPASEPQTTGQPVIKERQDIVVSGPSPKGSNAGPWLAAVGAFGLLGGGMLFSRRRRLRMLAEL